MGLSLEQLVEKCFIAGFPGQDQQQKQLYRFEIESWVDEARSQLGREVALSQDYQLLQQSTTLVIPALANGVYRITLGATPQFLTSFFDETGTVQFDGTIKTLSWVPNISYKGIVDRADTWYWTLEGNQVVFWPGSADLVLPAASLKITGNIIPLPTEIPIEYHDRAIALCIQKATDRALRLQTRRTQQVK